MNFKILIISVITLTSLFITSIVHSDDLCIKVVTNDRSPAVGSSITLRTQKIFADNNGQACFQSISTGRYQVSIQWRGKTSRCSVETSESNTCFIQSGNVPR